MQQKICALVLTFVLALTSFGTALAAEPPNAVQSKLALIEQDTYGQEQTGALIDRINKLADRRDLRRGLYKQHKPVRPHEPQRDRVEHQSRDEPALRAGTRQRDGGRPPR